MKTKNVIFAAMLFVSLGVCAETPFVAVYDFVEINRDTVTFAYNGNVFEGINFDNLTKNNITSKDGGKAFKAEKWDIGTFENGNFTGDINLDKYITFSIFADENYLITIDSISFSICRSGTGPRQWQWRGSKDNFENPFIDYSARQIGIDSASNGIITARATEVTTTSKNILRFGNELVNTSTVSFRLYGYNAGSVSGTGGLQNALTIYGSYEKVLSTTLEEISSKEKIKIYPNPAKDFITIANAGKIVIFNILGKQMLETTSTLINVEHFEKGIYFIKSEKSVVSFIKE